MLHILYHKAKNAKRNKKKSNKVSLRRGVALQAEWHFAHKGRRHKNCSRHKTFIFEIICLCPPLLSYWIFIGYVVYAPRRVTFVLLRCAELCRGWLCKCIRCNITNSLQKQYSQKKNILHYSHPATLTFISLI